ncbi:FISUMP domain-containing protein [Flavivirga rizhaonensis]|uniref:Fibronectin type-III domain-containing protein n=1 Tax=Flavivirga rizhaonensis TaxID=2559571 RepID=A0A4S1E0T7_9FLAO|nr:FISUMP domain-containing protein [Flavivirga rizhaonensis]TGV04196.1 hypothetical protein EM932_03395 [Flavivirga rizhaonensis]
MKYINKILLLIVVMVFIPLISCEDDDVFVEKKPSITLLSPTDKTDGVDIAPSFEWQASDPDGRPLKYDFYLGLDSTKLFVQAENLKETSYNLIDYKLRKDVVYYWKVVVKNGLHEQESEFWRFMSIPAPDTPILASPQADVFIRDVLTFEWEPISAGEGETISYNVFLGKTNPPTEIVGTVDDGSTSFTVDASTLEIGEVYYWKVDATDLINSSSSDIRSFKKLSPGAPDEPIIVSPVNKSGVAPGAILDWSDVTDPEGDAVSYDVYIDKQNTPTTLVATVTTSEYTPSTLDINSAYYWYVVAKDAAGNSTPSRISGFTAISNSPGFPGIHEFAVQDVLSLDELLVWDAATGATSYDVYIDTVNPPVNKVASDITETEYLVKNSEIPSDITDVKTYYALVVAKDGSGGESNSFPVAFTPQMTGTITDTRAQEVNNYNWVRIGTQIWLSQNLRTKKLTNGDDLTLLTIDNPGLPTDKYYDEHAENLDGFTPNWLEVHGRVYCRALVSNPLIAPAGWHVMNVTDINTLKNYKDTTPGDLMGKWHAEGLDTYGLDLITAGFRYPSTSDYENGFRTGLEKGRVTLMVDDGKEGCWELNNTYNKTFRYFNYTTKMSFGIRLVKNE